MIGIPARRMFLAAIKIEHQRAPFLNRNVKNEQAFKNDVSPIRDRFGKRRTNMAQLHRYANGQDSRDTAKATMVGQ